MDRTLASDFNELGALLVGQRSGQLNVEIDSVDLSLFRLAIFTISCVDPRVSK